MSWLLWAGFPTFFSKRDLCCKLLLNPVRGNTCLDFTNKPDWLIKITFSRKSLHFIQFTVINGACYMKATGDVKS